MRRLLPLLAACILAACSPASSQVGMDSVSWVNPTTYVDGSQIPAGDLQETLLQWGSSPSGPFTEGSATVPAPGTSTTIPRQVVGQRCYAAFAVSKTRGTSAASNIACKTITGPPNPPSNLTVN